MLLEGYHKVYDKGLSELCGKQQPAAPENDTDESEETEPKLRWP